MILIQTNRLPKRVYAIALFPFILTRDKNNMIVNNHEKIHIRQQAELLILPFYILYLFEWLILTIKYKDSHKAYKNISFEREAYTNEYYKNYLNNRKVFSFIKYYKK